MKVIHILRKPLSEGTVASNVLKHGTGGLNIDASRIAFHSEADEAESKTKNQHVKFGSRKIGRNRVYGDYSRVPHKNYTAEGRWPANVVLQHLEGCRCEGVKKVKGHTGYPNGPGGKSMHYSSSAKSADIRPDAWEGHADKDGNESMANWICEPGCPVAALDEQSGTTTSSGGRAYQNTNDMFSGGWSHKGGGVAEDPGYGDTGGASRFYKQVGGSDE